MISAVLAELIAKGIKVEFSSIGNGNQGHNALISLRDGVEISVGFGNGQYCSSRYDSFDLPTALLSAKTAEFAVYLNSNMLWLGRSGVIGYGSTRQLRALIRKWS